jgi:hypothetical protein
LHGGTSFPSEYSRLALPPDPSRGSTGTGRGASSSERQLPARAVNRWAGHGEPEPVHEYEEDLNDELARYLAAPRQYAADARKDHVRQCAE